MPYGLHSFSSEGLTLFSCNFVLILTKTNSTLFKIYLNGYKNVPSINVEETEQSTNYTSLVYNLKEGKWQKSLINDSDDFSSDSECDSESKM